METHHNFPVSPSPEPAMPAERVVITLGIVPRTLRQVESENPELARPPREFLSERREKSRREGWHQHTAHRDPMRSYIAGVGVLVATVAGESEAFVWLNPDNQRDHEVRILSHLDRALSGRVVFSQTGQKIVIGPDTEVMGFELIDYVIPFLSARALYQASDWRSAFPALAALPHRWNNLDLAKEWRRRYRRSTFSRASLTALLRAMGYTPPARQDHAVFASMDDVERQTQLLHECVAMEQIRARLLGDDNTKDTVAEDGAAQESGPEVSAEKETN